jgi:hypothetical protein
MAKACGDDRGDLKESGVTHMTEKYGPRLVEQGACAYLRPTIVHCTSPGSGDRQEGIHVPLLDRGRVPAGADAQEDRPDAGLHGDHQDEKLIQQLTDATTSTA